jgi:hypothetical protein
MTTAVQKILYPLVVAATFVARFIWWQLRRILIPLGVVYLLWLFFRVVRFFIGHF